MAKDTAPKATEQQPPPQNEEISAEEASKQLITAAAVLQRAWLQASLTVGRAIASGKPVSPGSFEDLRRIREQFEELDRANQAVTRIAQASERAKSAAADKKAN